jgi:hypothetical protein
MDFWAWINNQRDRALAVLLVVLGAVALVAGWLGVSRAVLTTQQLPYLASGAVGGVFLLGAAATLWLSADLRDEWRKLDAIHREIQRLVDQQDQGVVDPPGDTQNGQRPLAEKARRRTAKVEQ